MSRTREISGIVTRTSGIGDKAVYQFIENGQSQGIYEKAKLIIELPSPRITISEDDIDKAFNSIRYLEVHENNLCPYTVRHLRMALFKDAE